VKSDKSKDRDEGFKEEVSYGAIIYYQIMNCLKSGRGRETVLDIGGRRVVSVRVFDEFEFDVEHLVSLVSVIGDDEFNEELEEIKKDYDYKLRRLESERNEERKYEHSFDGEAEAEYYQRVQNLKHSYNHKRFNACLRLLKRQGIIIESLMRGGFK
jgi:L-arabinose isomerase